MEHPSYLLPVKLVQRRSLGFVILSCRRPMHRIEVDGTNLTFLHYVALAHHSVYTEIMVATRVRVFTHVFLGLDHVAPLALRPCFTNRNVLLYGASKHSMLSTLNMIAKLTFIRHALLGSPF